jgi:hypothetical protein
MCLHENDNITDLKNRSAHDYLSITSDMIKIKLFSSVFFFLFLDESLQKIIPYFIIDSK